MIVAETFWKVLCRDGAHRSLVTACRSSASVMVTLHVRAWEPCAWWLLPKGTGRGTGPELGHGIPLRRTDRCLAEGGSEEMESS